MRLSTVALSLLLVAAARAQVAPHEATVERVATGFAFTEGPALGPDGAIYFSDTPKRKVHRYDPATGETTVFLEDSGGSNGLAFDRQGRLVLCEDRDRRVSRLEDGQRVTLADQYDGKRLNSPNDLVIGDHGGIYFTDPRFGKGDNRELEAEAVYYLSPRGDLHQIITDLKKPNGVTLSPDGKTLYVADNRASLVMAYDVAEPGVIENGRVFASVEGKGGPDGMTVDADGNLYAAWFGGGGVHVWSPAGEHLGLIRVPERASNVEFGPDGKTLYITGSKSLYRAR